MEVILTILAAPVVQCLGGKGPSDLTETGSDGLSHQLPDASPVAFPLVFSSWFLRLISTFASAKMLPIAETGPGSEALGS